MTGRLALMLACAVAAVAALIRFGLPAAAPGLLAGWIFCLSLALGGALWLLIGVLTGGGWVEAGRPTLTTLARAVPIVALFGLAIPFALETLYPWAGAPAGNGREAHYLSADLFTMRLAAFLAVFSAVGLLAPLVRRPAAAALLLMAFAAALTFAATDWVLSRDQEFGSTAFAAALAVLQLALAASAVCLAGLPEGRAAADWGGLLLASTLGWAYLIAMQYLVLWTGNLPPDADWYRSRSGALGAGAVILGQVLPFLALLPTRLRSDPRALRLIAPAVLLAGWMQVLRWTVPEPADLAAASALAGVVLIAAAAGVLHLAKGRTSTEGAP